MVRFYRELNAKPSQPAQQQATEPGTRLAQMSGSMDAPTGTANAGVTTTPSSFPPMEEIDLPGVGRTQLDPETAKAVKKWMDLNTQKGIGVNFTSGFRDTAKQQRLQSNSQAISPAKPGTSLHEAGRAVDIDPNFTTDDATLQIILQHARKAGFLWGGDFKKPDKVHFYQEVPGGRSKRGEYIPVRQKEHEQWREKRQKQ